MDNIPLDPAIRELLVEKWKDCFGEVVPLNDFELAHWTKNVWLLTNNQPLVPHVTHPLDQLPHFIPDGYQLQASGSPVALPFIEVPVSAFCFFKKEWAKKKNIVLPAGMNKREHGGEHKKDPHAIIWNTLTAFQKEMWSTFFIHRREQAEVLIRHGFCRKALSCREIKKAEKMKKIKMEQDG